MEAKGVVRITCGKCGNYSRSLLRCTYGKVNPRTRKGTLEAAQFGGWSYVCYHNPWIVALMKESLI